MKAHSPTRTVPVPAAHVRRLGYAVIGAGVFLIVATVQGLTRPGYDAWHQSVSALAVGPGGWVQSVNFIALGAVLLSTVPVWRSVLRGGRGARAFPALTATTGLSLIVLAFLPQDPAPGDDPLGLDLAGPTGVGLAHLTFAGVASLGSVAGMLVLAARFAGDPHWRRWRAYSILMASLTIACVAVYGVWSVQPTGLAGLFERLAAVIPAVWVLTVLWRLRTGAPFIALRTQYYFRPSEDGLLAWDVGRLIRLSRTLPRHGVPLNTLRELDEPWPGDDERPTWRALVDHVRLIRDADLAYPVILSQHGDVMDGRHRIAKALLERRRHIDAVRFEQDPEPDHVGRGPDDLPY